MKKILLVMLLLFSFFIPSKVLALEDKFYDAEYIPGAYIVKIKNSDGTGRYQQMKFFRRRSDGKPVYCLEIWKGLNIDKTLTGYDYDQYKYANIDFATMERVKLVAYYGYGYGNHTESKWFAVTQYMIWQLTSQDTTLYFTDTLNGNRNDNKFKEEIDEINYLINHHTELPSFHGKYFDLKYNEPLILVDENNVLKNFEILGCGLLNVDISDNKITVLLDKVSDEQIFLKKEDKIYSNYPTVFIDDTGQNILVAGKYETILSINDFRLPGSSVTINKLDKETNSSQGDASLSGSVFEIIDDLGKVVKTVETDSNGKVTFDIGYGNYKLREIKAGNGYKINNEVIDLDISSSNKLIDFYNEVIKNKIIINKYIKNSVTGETNIEKYAKFQVIDKDNNVVTEVSTSKGFSEFELPYGEYTIKQIKGLKNYRYVDDFRIKVDSDGEVQTFNLYNEIFTNKITINKYIKNNDFVEVEEGAKFQILDKEGNLFLEFETDKNGYYETILPVGSYTVKQVSGKDNYKYVDDFKIVVSKDNEEKHYDLYNEIYTNKIIINKFIRNTITGEEKIEVGAKFQILDSNLNLVKELTTNKNGSYTINLPYGEYLVKQIKGLKDYKYIEDFTIKVDSDGEVQTFNLYNDIYTSKVSFNKYTKYNDMVEVEDGAKFQILDNSNNIFLEFVTDENGYYETLLPIGSYTVKQISGKDNYQLIKDFNITISKEEDNHYDLYNERFYVSLSINNLDNETKLPISGSDNIFIINNKDDNTNYELIAVDGYTPSIELVNGNYSVYQVSVSSNYILNEEIFNLEINEDNYLYKQDINLEINNDPKKKTIIDMSKTTDYYYNDQLIESKKDDEYNVPLYAKEDIYSNDGNVLYEKNSMVDSINENNNYVLTKGEYYLNDEVNNQVVNISVKDEDNININFNEKVYEYDNNCETVINVPNTLVDEFDINKIYLLLISLCFSILVMVKKYEKN